MTTRGYSAGVTSAGVRGVPNRLLKFASQREHLIFTSPPLRGNRISIAFNLGDIKGGMPLFQHPAKAVRQRQCEFAGAG